MDETYLEAVLDVVDAIPSGRAMTPTEQYELQRWLETVTLAVKELQTASSTTE